MRSRCAGDYWDRGSVMIALSAHCRAVNRTEAVTLSKTKVFLRNTAEYAGGVMIFLLTAVYVFAALGLFSLGLVTFPSVMLGRLGFLTVSSDLSQPALVLGSAGVFLLGTGMCLCIIPVCSAMTGAVANIIKRSDIRRKRILYEEDKTA